MEANGQRGTTQQGMAGTTLDCHYKDGILLRILAAK